MIRCSFCGRFVKRPKNLEEIQRCQCGALYFACSLKKEPFLIAKLMEKIGPERAELRRVFFYDRNFGLLKEPFFKEGRIDQENTLVVPFVRSLKNP